MTSRQMLDELKESFIEWHLKKGDVLYDEQDKSSDGYIVIEGIVEITQTNKLSNDRNNTSRHDVTEGEVFGVWKTIFAKPGQFFSAKAKTDCSVLVIPSGLIQQKIEKADPFLVYCMRHGR